MKRVANVFALFAVVIATNHCTVTAEDPPGVVVSKSPDFKETYVGSPSIAILPSGDLLATHVWFGPKSTQDTTVVFSSSDRGLTWKQIAEIKGQFWSTLFVHNNDLYLFGTDKALGSLVIRHSVDQGNTWTEPKDQSTGLLLQGKYFTSPVPVVVHNNRIWRSFEQFERLRSLVMVASAPVDSDLLDAASWSVTEPIAMDADQLGGQQDRMVFGNVVAHPEAGLVNLMTLENPRADRAAILPISEDGERISYEPSKAFVDMPGGRSKFTVRYDPVSKLFWTVSNQQHDPFAIRNKLVLAASANLRDWDVKTILLHHVDSIWHGSHHADWQFDGNDIVAVCQTSGDGARSSNNSNYLTFHRFENFRSMNNPYAQPMFGRVNKTSIEHSDFDLTGTQFTIGDFKDNTLAFASYKLKFNYVPKQFDGWMFTRTVPGSTIEMKVTVKRDCDLFFTTQASGGGVIDVTGWSPIESGLFHYSNRTNVPMAVFSRSVKRGDTLKIPQGNWSGGMLLIPPETK